jgi:hypothetical protein
VLFIGSKISFFCRMESLRHYFMEFFMAGHFQKWIVCRYSLRQQ